MHRVVAVDLPHLRQPALHVRIGRKSEDIGETWLKLADLYIGREVCQAKRVTN